MHHLHKSVQLKQEHFRTIKKNLIRLQLICKYFCSMTDCIFNAENFSAVVQEGLWKVLAYVSKDGVTLGGIQYFGSVTKKE